jgi:flagellar biosynthesis/type III secretory pathway protein FliH
MNQTERFLFDREFSSEIDDSSVYGAARGSGARKSKLYTETELKSAISKATAEGVAKGKVESEANREQQLADSLSSIARELEKLNESLAQTKEQLAHDTIAVAISMVRKLYPETYGRTADSEVCAFAKEFVTASASGIQFKVYVHPEIQSSVSSHLSGDRDRSNSPHELVVFADDALVPGDCRIEWPGGGASRCAEEIWSQVDQRLATLLGPESAAASLLPAPLLPPENQLSTPGPEKQKP